MNATIRKVIAHAPEACDICGNRLREGLNYYDAKTYSGSWAWMCFGCFRRHGRGIGIGVGQEYDSKTNEKVRG